jgi:hypothetical protein
MKLMSNISQEHPVPRAFIHKFYPQSFFGDGIIIHANQPNHELLHVLTTNA